LELREIKMNSRDRYTFWKLMNKYEIEIPIIQRDYAQGRESERRIAEKFVSSLHKAILNN
jgi:hypothetical protein